MVWENGKSLLYGIFENGRDFSFINGFRDNSIFAGTSYAYAVLFSVFLSLKLEMPGTVSANTDISYNQ